MQFFIYTDYFASIVKKRSECGRRSSFLLGALILWQYEALLPCKCKLLLPGVHRVFHSIRKAQHMANGLLVGMPGSSIHVECLNML